LENDPPYSPDERRRFGDGAASGRRVWHLLSCAGRRAVEACERAAAGRADAGELEEAVRGACQVVAASTDPWAPHTLAAWAARRAAEGQPNEAACNADAALRVSERPPADGDRSWRTAEVLRLAEAIHAERAFDRLPILADLLEEAGATDAALLAHLRGPGPHAQDCHALDAVLRKG
jgi:hypothetical protein